MKRFVTSVLGLSVALTAVWLAVSRVQAGSFRADALDEEAPYLDWERPDGSGELPDGLVVVHFWATWCEPCRSELPGLLAAAEAEGTKVIAVTNEPWHLIERFFDGEVPAAVVRSDAGDDWAVDSVPDTYLVRDQQLVAQAGGVRDWTSRGARRFLRGELP